MDDYKTGGQQYAWVLASCFRRTPVGIVNCSLLCCSHIIAPECRDRNHGKPQTVLLKATCKSISKFHPISSPSGQYAFAVPWSPRSAPGWFPYKQQRIVSRTEPSEFLLFRSYSGYWRTLGVDHIDIGYWNISCSSYWCERNSSDLTITWKSLGTDNSNFD